MPTPRAGYRLKDGTRVPGTTTIVGRYKDSGALINWAYRQGKEHADLEFRGLPAPSGLYDKVQEAADIGTTIHAMVEAHIDGAAQSVIDGIYMGEHEDEDARAACESGFAAYRAWEKQSGLKIVAQEIQLVSEEYRFGGTPDAIGEIDGELCLLDWKSSSGIYPDHLIQIAAYKYLVEHGVRTENRKPLWYKGEPGLKMVLNGGFHLCRFAKEHGDFGHHYFPQLDDAWEAFKHMRALYDIDKQLKKRAK